MATAKSDDESDVSSHPLAENRPGVYVQVVAPRRRKKSKRSESASSSRPPAGVEARGSAREQSKARGGVREETDARVRARRQSDPRVAESDETALPPSGAPQLSAQAQEEADDLSASPSEAPTVVGRFEVPDMFGSPAEPRASTHSEPATEPGLTGLNARAVPRASTVGAADGAEEDDGRQSGERPVDFDSVRVLNGSDNSNQRPDLLGMSIPPPPRLPSFVHGEEPSERSSAMPTPVHSASLLDAPPTLRPGAQESTPAARSSATLLAFVAAFTAIIVMAGLVALRELAKPDAPAAQRTRAVIGAPAQPAPVAAPAQPAPAATPASPAANVAPTPSVAVPAAVLPAATGVVAPRGQSAARPAGAKKAAPGRALVAKANAALRQLSDTGLKATPQTEPEPAAEEEERAPNPDEPLELPVNPY